MRLTEKDKNTFLTKQPFTEMINKLGQLEDIEEELGIDLKTFFRIYSAKHFYLKGKDYKWKIHHRCNNGIVVGTNKLIYLPFKFYGKTWALTKEELEND